MPDVMLTVVVPVHNLLESGKIADFNLLIELLDLQTSDEFEVLVLDNASNDGTVEILKDYRNKGYFRFMSERDNSKVEAWNKALMLGKGKYFVFLSCDDFIHDITAIRTAVALMEQENADIMMSSSYVRHPDGFVFEFKPAIYNLFQAVPCMRQSMLFRKSAIAKVDYFDEKFHIMSDYDLLIRMIMNHCKPIIYDKNIVTCKYSDNMFKFPDKVNEEFSRIFFKNYRTLYKMTDDILADMVKFSHLPDGLLNKLSQFYPPQDKEFLKESVAKLESVRREAIKQQEESNNTE